MEIALVDVDSHNFPNLPFQKETSQSEKKAL